MLRLLGIEQMANQKRQDALAPSHKRRCFIYIKRNNEKAALPS